MSKIYAKKAQGLSLNTIIIAIIVLVVLVVLVLVFTGGIQNIFIKGVKQCEAQGGECSDTCVPPRDKIITTYGDDVEGVKAATEAGCANANADKYCCRKALL